MKKWVHNDDGWMDEKLVHNDFHVRPVTGPAFRSTGPGMSSARDDGGWMKKWMDEEVGT